MTSFSSIGTGNMATAIGGLLADGGSTVSYISKDRTGTAPLDGDIVVLAVPYPAVDGIITAYGAQLDGKVVVDITNPLNFETFDSLVVPAGSSAAAQIQAQIPGASVLKAFNTTFAATLAAKEALAAAVVAGGVAAADAGSLSPAPTNSRLSASSSSPSPSPRRSAGPAASPPSPDPAGSVGQAPIHSPTPTGRTTAAESAAQRPFGVPVRSSRRTVNGSISRRTTWVGRRAHTDRCSRHVGAAAHVALAMEYGSSA